MSKITRRKLFSGAAAAAVVPILVPEPASASGQRVSWHLLGGRQVISNDGGTYAIPHGKLDWGVDLNRALSDIDRRIKDLERKT